MMSSPAPNQPISSSARKTQVRALFFLLAALVAGGGAVFLVRLYLEQIQRHAAEQSIAEVTTTPVVVAGDDIRAGMVLTVEHLSTVAWPEEHLPPGSFGSVDEVVGLPVVRDIAAGVPIMRRQLADPESGEGLAVLLAAEGARAMTVAVDRVIGVFGFVQPGDFVDVISTITPDAETKAALELQPSRVSKIVLQNVRVLAVGQHLHADRREPRQVQAVTLEVMPEESERLALATEYGRIQLTLRAPTDRAFVATPGITPLCLLLDDERSLEDLFVRTREELEAKRAAQTRPRAVRRTPAPQPRDDPAPVVEMLRGSRDVQTRTVRSSE